MSPIERAEGEKRAYLDGFRAGVDACHKQGARPALQMADTIEATLPEPQHAGAVSALDALADAVERVLPQDRGKWPTVRAALIEARSLTSQRGQ